MATRKKVGAPEPPPKVYHRHMMSHEVSILYVYSRWPGLVTKHEVHQLKFEGYVSADGKVIDAGRRRLVELGESTESA